MIHASSLQNSPPMFWIAFQLNFRTSPQPDVIVGSVAAMPMAYSASGNLWLVLLVTILIGAVYFVLTSWLMKNKLDLE